MGFQKPKLPKYLTMCLMLHATVYQGLTNRCYDYRTHLEMTGTSG